MAVAGLVVGQAQTAAQLVAGAFEGRLGGGQAVAVQQLVGHADLFQHGDVAAGRLQLRLGAEQLQRAARALFIMDAGGRAQFAQAIAAVLGQAQHAFLVDRVALGRTVGQHGRHPFQLEQAAVQADRQRRVLLEQPLDGLHRNAGRGPRRGITGRDLAGVGVAGLLGGRGLAVQHRHFGALAGQVIGGRRADDTAAEDDHMHDSFRWLALCRNFGSL